MWLLQLGFAPALHCFLSVLGCEQHGCARWEMQLECKAAAVLLPWGDLGASSGGLQALW